MIDNNQMHRSIQVINFITASGGVILIFMSLWPGFAGGCVAFLALPFIALLGMAWLNVFVVWLLRAGEGRKTVSLARLAVAPALVCLTLIALIFYIPRRIAFVVCQSQFDRLVASVPINEDGGAPFEHWVGIYHVDRYATNPTGGVFFRTGSSGLFLDTDSYGFVYHPDPNSKYTPFGHRGYELHPLSGGWFWFSVTWHF